MCVLGPCRGQKRASNLLEIELQSAVSHHVGARSQTLVLWKSSHLIELSLQPHRLSFCSLLPSLPALALHFRSSLSFGEWLAPLVLGSGGACL